MREDVGAQPPLYELAGRGPSEIALEDERRASTWAELEERTNAFGHGLESLGAGPGQHVALIGTNRIEFYETVLGTTRAGCVLSPLKTSWAPPAIRFVLDDAQTRVVVTDVEAGRVAAREAGIPYVDLDDVEEWLGAQDRSSFPADRAGRRMSYTSGTTGRPKGIVRPGELPFVDHFAGGRSLPGDGAAIPRDGWHLMVSALFHGAPLTFSIAILGLGVPLRIMARWEPERALASIQQDVSSITMVPTMFRQLLTLPEEQRAAFSAPALQLVMHGGEPCPIPLKRRMVEWWGPIFIEYFGSSEGGLCWATTEEWETRPGTVGQPVMGMTAYVIDPETGAELPPRTEGQIYFSLGSVGEYRLFSYLNDPEKTDAAYRGNRFTVGDIGWLDEDGYLYISGRKADVIVSSGVNVYPAEVEAVIGDVEGVADVGVVSAPDDIRGESVAAFIVLAPGADADAVKKAIDERAERDLGGYQRPRQIHVREELPRDPVGKLLRNSLREELWKGHDGFAAAAPPSKAERST